MGVRSVAPTPTNVTAPTVVHDLDLNDGYEKSFCFCVLVSS